MIENENYTKSLGLFLESSIDHKQVNKQQIKVLFLVDF